MRLWLLGMMIISILSFSGCRNNPRVTRELEQMGSQRRALEDQIYDLQYEYDKKAVEASRLQQENASLRAELEQVKSASIEAETGVGGPALIDLSVGEQHARIEPQKQIESIHPVSHAAFTDKPQRSTSDVQSLEINKLRSVFRDADSNGLIDTIVLHITPQNQAGDYIPHADYVDVVIRHNDATGKLVAQWKIAQRQVKRIMETSIYKQTIPLELKLSGELEDTVSLFVDVRYGTRGPGQSGVLTSKGISTSRSDWTPYR